MKLGKSKLEELKLQDNVMSKKYEHIRETNRFSKYYHDLWNQKIVDLIDEKPRKILDYCCGTSKLFPFIRKSFNDAEYLGIDLSEKMIEIAQRRFKKDKKFKVCRQDGENLNLRSNYFDVVISRGAIHHFPHPEKGLREINKVLKTGGILILTEPTSNILIKYLRKVVYSIHKDFSSSHTSFTDSEMKNLLNKNGFEIKSSEHFGLMAFPFAFPDIFPVFKYLPFLALSVLEYTDRFLLKIPVVNTFSFISIIKAEKVA